MRLARGTPAAMRSCQSVITQESFMRTSFIRSLTFVAVMSAPLSLAFARGPAQNVSPHRHPNIAAAQQLSEQAFAKLAAAQSANEFDMAGHAAKAKELLSQANSEMKLAAEAANK